MATGADGRGVDEPVVVGRRAEGEGGVGGRDGGRGESQWGS